MAERPRLIAELDKKLADIEAAHARLIDEAATVGVQLAHLEVTASRRLVAKAAAEWVADRDDRDERANAASVRRRS